MAAAALCAFDPLYVGQNLPPYMAPPTSFDPLPPYAPTQPVHNMSLPHYAVPTHLVERRRERSRSRSRSHDRKERKDMHRDKIRSRSRSRDRQDRQDRQDLKDGATFGSLDQQRQQRLDAMAIEGVPQKKQYQQIQQPPYYNQMQSLQQHFPGMMMMQQQGQQGMVNDRGVRGQGMGQSHPFAKTLSFARSLLMELYLVNGGRFLDVDSTCCSSPFKYGHFHPMNVRFCTSTRDYQRTVDYLARQQGRNKYPSQVSIINFRDHRKKPQFSHLMVHGSSVEGVTGVTSGVTSGQGGTSHDMFEGIAPNSLDSIVALKGLQDFLFSSTHLKKFLTDCFEHLSKNGCLIGLLISGTIINHYMYNVHPMEHDRQGIQISPFEIRGRDNNNGAGGNGYTNPRQDDRQLERQKNDYARVNVQFPFFRCVGNSVITDDEFQKIASEVGFEVQISAPLKDFLQASANTKEYQRLSGQFFKSDPASEISTSLNSDLKYFFRPFVLIRK